MPKFVFEDPKLLESLEQRGPLALAAEADQQILRCCATVRFFDQTLYTQVLQSEGALTFAELTAHRLIERLPGPEERYQVCSLRTELFASWWPPEQSADRSAEIPRALRNFSERLVAYYKKQNEPLEALYHLVAVDRAAAIQQLDELFQPALDQFDLTRCHAILRLLEERDSSPLRLGVELANRMKEKRLQLETRTMWAYEYYETIVYLERAQTKDLVQELMADPHCWILHLFAMGGMGKTMFIRAVIARYCVPHGIPCARIDFDFVPHIANIAREPWRLLLHIAEQLNRQLLNGPFSGLLASYAQFAAETGKRRIASPRTFVPVSQDAQQSMRQTAIDRFIDIIRENWNGRPLLLIFDTLENLRNRQLDLTDAFDLLKGLHEQCPQLRVILAGRFDLADAIAAPDAKPNQIPDSARVSGYVERFKDQERTVKLSGFSQAEARAYLETKRALAGDPRLEVMIDKSIDKRTERPGDNATTRQDDTLYNPFKLALLADIVTANPKLTAGEIADYANVDLVYLIERVVERIDDPGVRWLLRYGVAPRQLTLDFVRQVALPYLLQAIQGKSAYDDPQADRLPAEVLQRQPFPQDRAMTTLDVDALWQTLYGYASNYSWVWSSNAMTNALAFHPDVIAPMRSLLRDRAHPEHDIYLRLHRDAVRHFERLADSDPARRAQWLSEAVYHKYRSEEPDADVYWRQQLTAASEDSEVARALAEAVLNPLPVDQDLPVSPAVKAMAAYSLARHTLESHTALLPADRFHLHEWLTMADKWNTPMGDSPTPVLSSSQLDYLRAYLAHEEGQKEQALALCEAALAHPADVQNELDLCLLHGDVLKDLAQPSALDAYRHAWELASSAAPKRLATVTPRLAAELMEQERYTEAIAIYEQSFEDALTARHLDMAANSLLAIIQAYVALGCEATAVRVGNAGVAHLEESFASATDQATSQALCASWSARLRAEIALARHLPDPANLELRRISLETLADAAPATYVEWQIALADLQARTAILQFDVQSAEAQLEKLAYDLYRPASYKGGLALLRLAQLWLDPVRDPSHADADLRQAARFITSAELKVRGQLLEIQRLTLAGEQTQALALAQSLAAAPDQPTKPSLRLLVALEHAIQSNLAPEPCATLLTALQTLETPTQRLALLDGLHRCPTPSQPPSHLADPLLALLPTADATGQDPALAALRLAHVHRLLGDTNQANVLLLDAERACKEPLRLEILRNVWRGHDQLGWSSGVLAAWEIDLRRRRAWKTQPLSASLILLEHAERIYSVLDDRSKAQELLNEAKELAGPSSLWQARIANLEHALAQPRTVFNTQGQQVATPYNAGRNIHTDIQESTSGVADMGDYLLVGGVRLNKKGHGTTTALEKGISFPSSPAIVDEGDYLNINGIRLQKRQVDPTAATPIDLYLSWHSEQQLRLVAIEWKPEGQYWDDTHTLPDWAHPLLTLNPDEAVNHQFLRQFVADRQTLAEQISAYLLDPTLRARLAGGAPYDIEWATHDLQLAWAPWELLLVDDATKHLPLTSLEACRCFSRPLTASPQSERDRAHKSPVDVLIIRLGEHVERQITRGYSQSTGERLLDLYARAGLHSEEISEVDGERLAEALDKMQPAIVHLNAGFRDEGRRIFVELAGEQNLRSLSKGNYGNAGGSLSPKELGLALQRVRQAPLLILDPPAPPGEIERLRQLCLRNAFAAELARKEHLPALLAVGLGQDGYAQQQLNETIAQMLAQGETIGAIASQLRRTGSTEQGDWLAFTGVALFANDPNTRFVNRAV